jgi:PKHD-type hydroxylase
MMEERYVFPKTSTANQSNYYWFQEGFTAEELIQIEELTQNLDFVQGTTEGGNPTDTSVRNSQIKWVPFSPETKWIYDRLGMYASEANNELFQFDIDYMPENIQYTEYYGSDQGGYEWHMDIGSTGGMNLRKISITVQLSDSDEYEGGDLQLWTGGTMPLTAPRGKGNVVVFPSFMLHRVTPVTTGTRKSFVIWLGGGHYR